MTEPRFEGYQGKEEGLSKEDYLSSLREQFNIPADWITVDDLWKRLGDKFENLERDERRDDDNELLGMLDADERAQLEEQAGQNRQNRDKIKKLIDASLANGKAKEVYALGYGRTAHLKIDTKFLSPEAVQEIESLAKAI